MENIDVNTQYIIMGIESTTTDDTKINTIVPIHLQNCNKILMHIKHAPIKIKASTENHSDVMHFIFATVFCIINANTIKGASDNPIFNLTDILTSLLTTGNGTSTRIADLKSKIDVINKFTLNADKLSLLLMDIARHSKLNNTNFFNAIIDKDQFRFVSNDSKNLYLKLKEKLNRDDVNKILAEKANIGEMVKHARRMGERQVGTKEDIVNEVVDKMLAEKPNDDHKFDAKANMSEYWDPQGELDDLQEHHRHDGRRIYKGERTTIRYYPFMASIHVMGRFWCGGVIYWSDLVLTSAACLQLMHNNRFFRENPKALSVRIGSNHSRIGGEKINALEVYFHPSYNPKTLRNNIAVIRLPRKLTFNYHRTPKMIAITHETGSVPNTAEVLLLGWGVTRMSNKMAYEPIFLQRKILPIYPNYFCKEVYGDKFIKESMFCAGTLTTGEGACDHDAGGPAILAGKLVGIISFGPSLCGFPNAPTVFTLVGFYSDWIETVNESMPEYYRGKARTTTSTPNPLIDFFNTWDPQAEGQHTKRTTRHAVLPVLEDEITEKPLEAHHDEHPIPELPPLEVEVPVEETTPKQPERVAIVRGIRADETDDDWSIME